MTLTEHAERDLEEARRQDYAEARLASLRLKNDGDLDPIQTARLRGQIFELKQLLELDKPPPAVTQVDDAD